MDIQKILSCVDHTILGQAADWAAVQAICEDALRYKTASVCIQPCYVRQAKEFLAGRIAVCTVIGFPNGYNSTEVKLFEAAQALKDGADELDMVINVGWLKAGKDELVLDEIRRLKEVCGDKILKVIIETCLLTEDEKIRMCRIVTEAGADFIKTSTGFSKGGATPEDIRLFAAHIGPNVRMKAAGGISSLEDAEEYLRLGCSRLGTSRIVKLVKDGQLAEGSY